MVLNKRILTRIDDKLLNKINKKLALKKYISYDKSKFIRVSINNFIEYDLFNYISNINAIITILNDMIIDYNGLNANFTQISEHLKNNYGAESKNTISNFKKLRQKNIKNVLLMKKLIKLLTPYEKQYKKENILISRIDSSLHKVILDKLDGYQNIQLDMSKLMRAALKYQLDKKYTALSEKQISLARELIANAKDVNDITNELNEMAFNLNIGVNVSFEEIIAVTGALNDIEDTTYSIVNSLYVESDKF